jgi:hypothetical protein
MGRAAAAGLFLVATGVACATATVSPRVEPTVAHVADAGDAPPRAEAPRASAGDAAGAPGDPAIVLAAPGDAGGAGATDCVGQHWRIEVSESGEWSDPRETLCDDGSFASVVFSTRASAGRAPASVTHDAQLLLTEMRQRGQLRRRVPPTSHPFAREDCNAERPEECPAETIGVTFDGVEYFVDFGAKDPQDPGPRTALPGPAIAWPNQRAVRLLALLRGLAPALKVPRPGKVTVTGKLSPEVVRRSGRHNFGRFHLCYENARRTNPTLAGRVLVHFVIGPSGRAATASDGGSDLPDPGVVACVVNGFTDLSFPRPEEGAVNVVYEVVFAPGADVPGTPRLDGALRGM